ncbi:MAG: class I SAM-dependent methyltransferase [Parvularculaceae bacterium]|nr:methyltransferase domain-containing protein [Parvularculaceae bacterium]
MTASVSNPVSAAAVDPRAMIARAYGDPKALSRRFRAKRFERVAAMIDRIIAAKGVCRIADIGGTKYYWDIAEGFVSARSVEITLINPKEAETAQGKFRHFDGDAADLGELDDMSFDFVHSNSVIEHVGDWERMSMTADNIRRLAPVYYVQTPNFWFPYEPHFRCLFVHWLPEQMRYRLVKRMSLGFAEAKKTVDASMRRVQSARLLDEGQMRALFPEAEIAREKFLGLDKSVIAYRD